MADYSYLTGKGDPSPPQLGAEIAASFVPGLNVVQALRDYKKAAEEKDYIGQGLSALGTIPGVGAAVKGGAALKAMLLGVPLADAKVQKMLELLRKGATEQEAWQDTGRALVPRFSNEISQNLNPSNDKLRAIKEISDAGLRPKLGSQMPQHHKLNIISQLDPLAQVGANKRVTDTDLFKPGVWQLENMIEHPELFAERPNFKSTNVDVKEKLANRGTFYPGLGDIDLGVESFLTSPSEGALSTLMHELMHKEQHFSNMPGGANVKLTDIKPEERTRLYNAYVEALKDPTTTEHAKWNMYNVVKEQHAPYNLYRNVLGEQQARAVQQRLKMTDAQRAEIHPNMNYEDLKHGVDPVFLGQLLQALRTTPGAPTPGMPRPKPPAP